MPTVIPPIIFCFNSYVHLNVSHPHNPNPLPNTEDAGLPYFDRAAVIVNRNWYYASALEPHFVFATV